MSSTLKSWISHLIKTYGFDGIRLDTLNEVPKTFWTEFAKSAGVFQIGNIMPANTNVGYGADYQNYVDGVFNYPMFSVMRDIWATGNSMIELSALMTTEAN